MGINVIFSSDLGKHNNIITVQSDILLLHINPTAPEIRSNIHTPQHPTVILLQVNDSQKRGECNRDAH